MDYRYFFCAIALGGCMACGEPAGNGETNTHTEPVEDADALYAFFRYEKGKTVISGHRGTVEFGLPENSIAAFEKVLEHTPAFFEIDPRLTKDSVVILMHDATLDRTTTGTGKVADHTWEELKELRLKDKDGRVTEHRIPTLTEVIEWARGKAILNLDRKDVPMAITAQLLHEHDAHAFVMVTVHAAEQARFYLDAHEGQVLSAHIKTVEQFEEYREAGIPFNRMIAYIGPDIKPENQQLYQLLNAEGVMCMISSAPTYDKLPNEAERAEAYRAIIADGASILESDFPIEVGKALKEHEL